MNLGEFKREVEYLDPEMDVDTPPVEVTIVFDTEPIIPGVNTPLPAEVQQRLLEVSKALSEAIG